MSRRRAILVAAALGALGCIQGDPLGQSPAPPDLGIIPATLYLSPGGSVGLTATSQLAAGGLLSWTSSAEEVATVSPAGVVTAVAPGRADIRARNGAGTARSAVTVAAAVPPVASWRIEHEGLTDVSLLGLHNPDPLNSFAVGSAGVILRSQDGGASWARMATPDSSDLVGIWGTSASNMVAVGGNGTILHFDGATWSRMPTPTTRALLDVFGFGPDDIYAVGAGVALHYDGAQWLPVGGAEAAELWAVWGTDRAHLFAAGQDGKLFRLAGNRWTPLPSPTSLLILGIWGSSYDDVWAVGIQGTVLHWEGSSWQPVEVPTSENLFAVWGRSGSEIVAVGDAGAMLQYNGVSWTRVPQTATAENLRAVHWATGGGAPAGGFVAAGWSGTTIRRGATGSWQLSAAAPLFYNIAPGPGGAPLAVGSAGALWRGGAGGAGSGAWVPLEVVRNASLYGASGDAQDVVAVGDAGLILRWDGTHWSDESVPPRRLLRSIWIDPAGRDGFVVGEQGIMLHRLGASGRWTERPALTSQFLRHVFGLDARTVFAVGDRGTALHWNGGAWRVLPTPSDTILRGVWGSGPDDVFAVGAAGTILRFDGVRWYPMASPTSRELRAVWGTGPTDVYAAGENGTLLRFDGARWTRMSSPTRVFLLAFQQAGGGVPRVVGGRGMVLVGER